MFLYVYIYFFSFCTMKRARQSIEGLDQTQILDESSDIFSDLVTVIESIKYGNFGCTHRNWLYIQRFKNENDQFPWKQLENLIREDSDKFSTRGFWCERRLVFQKKELKIFVWFVKNMDMSSLLKIDKNHWL